MMKLNFILLVLIFSGCCFEQPDQKRIENDLISENSNYIFISTRNIENSPPASYWYVEYINENKDTICEVWSYWEKGGLCEFQIHEKRLIKDKSELEKYKQPPTKNKHH